MSMATPRYYDDPDFQKWYDFETGQFKERYRSTFCEVPDD